MTCRAALPLFLVVRVGLLAGSLAWAGDAAPVQRPIAAEPSSTLELTDLQNKFGAIAHQVSPSVVAISATASAIDSDDALRSDTLNGQKLETLLDHATRIVGSGLVIDSDGYILTNEHVVGDTAQIWITTDNGKVYPAVVVGSDPRADLAVLKSPAHDLTSAKFAPPDSVSRGMWSIALGNPYGLAAAGQMSMSIGVISAMDRSLPKLASQENRLYSHLIQTTAEINPGNSGGPLFDIKGQVIGINTAVILPQKQTNGIGFAMPITAELIAKVRDLKEGREIDYAYVGVMVSTPTGRERQAASITDGSGVEIESVEKDSPAAVALQTGDIVLKVNDQTVFDSDQFVKLIGSLPVAQPAKFNVKRDGQPLSLSIQPRRRELPSVAINRANQRIRWHGMLLGPIPANGDLAPSKSPEHGLMVIGINPQSPLANQGVHSGTVITSVAAKPLETVTQLLDLINDTPAEQCRVEFSPPAQPLAKEAIVSGQ